jgi:hypothetical protein
VAAEPQRWRRQEEPIAPVFLEPLRKLGEIPNLAQVNAELEKTMLVQR